MFWRIAIEMNSMCQEARDCCVAKFMMRSLHQTGSEYFYRCSVPGSLIRSHIYQANPRHCEFIQRRLAGFPQISVPAMDEDIATGLPRAAIRASLPGSCRYVDDRAFPGSDGES